MPSVLCAGEEADSLDFKLTISWNISFFHPFMFSISYDKIVVLTFH